MQKDYKILKVDLFELEMVAIIGAMKLMEIGK